MYQISSGLADRIRRISTCDLADIAGPSCVLDYRIRPMTDSGIIVGPAFTVSLPEGTCGFVTEAIQKARPGDILVIEGHRNPAFALWGDFRSHLAKKQGLTGVIMDGAIRDLNACCQVGLPLYAMSVTPLTSTRDPGGQFNVPISCGGLTIHPGDIIVADDSGVICLEPEKLEEIVSKAEEKVAKQAAKIASLYQ